MNYVLLPTALVSLLALILYFWVAAEVSRMRARHGVKAPAMTGPEPFERAVRVHLNTLEQLVPFLVALWICAAFWPVPAAILGAIWILGRVIYALAYWRNPAKRGPGFTIAGAATILLMLGGFAGIIRGWLA